MGRPRAFDYEEARRLRALGLSYRQIGAQLGVSGNSVAKACDPVYRKRQDDKAKRWLEAMKDPCRGGCGVLVWYRGNKPSTGYCRACWAERVRFAAEMRDSHGTESRYVNLGCRCLECRRAASDAKRIRRERSRVPCVGCGTLVDAARRNPAKPPECPTCARKRIHAERKAAAAARKSLGVAA